MVKRYVSAAVLVVLVCALASGANAFTSDKRTYFTFNRPVALPGMTLPAGTYMFRIANTESSRNVIQVSNKQGTESYALLGTIQAQRPDVPRDSEIRFLETASGAPPAVGTYWYVGERTGYEFIYSKEQLAALNRTAQPAPAAQNEPVVPPIADTEKSTDVVEGAGASALASPAESRIAQAQQPAQPAQPEQPAAGATRDQLPKTASPLALLLLGGVAAAGLGVKLLRKS